MKLTTSQYVELIKRHPHLVSNNAPERKPSAKPALGSQSQKKQERPRSVELRCSIVQCRHRLLDDDNAIAGAKPLRDAIASSLGLNDADPRIKFEYGQIQTSGEPGVIVKIERI